MRLEEGLLAHLSQSPLTELVGEGIYPLLLPQGAPLPAVVYALVSTAFLPALQQDTTFRSQSLQLVCRGKTYKEAVQVGEAARVLLADYTGLMGEIDVQSVLPVGHTVYYETETKSYAALWEWRLQYSQDWEVP